jgi:2-C-methyl-D-erythritol 4-phosphate cytidylyltransferase
MKTVCIVPSAGSGRRLNKIKNKPYINIAGKPIIAHTLKALSKSPIIDSIIVVTAKDKMESCRRIIKRYKIKKIDSIVEGGKKRFDSVKNGIEKAKDFDFIFIHDGARPLINKKLIRDLFFAAKRYGAAIPATPVKQTVKRIKKGYFVKETPDRKLLWEAQTPQVFKWHLLQRAYSKKSNKNITDDSSLIEPFWNKVKVVKGSYDNIKITTPEDLKLAKILLKRKR